MSSYTRGKLYAGTHVTTPPDVPAGEHWAIIGGGSIYVPGDVRSITAPGHGYPAHNEPVITYLAFTDEAEFKTELAKQLSEKRPVRGIHVTGEQYHLKTSVEVITE